MDEVTVIRSLVAAGPAAVYLVGLWILYRQGQADRAQCRQREKELHEELLGVVEKYHESNEALATTLVKIADSLEVLDGRHVDNR